MATDLRRLLDGLVALLLSILVGLSAVVAVGLPAAASGTVLIEPGSAPSYNYDYRQDVPRPPPAEVASNGYDTATSSANPVADVGPLRRVSSGLGADRVAPSAARGPQFADEAAEGFGSMSSFRRAYGSAGPNAQWHHVVEQHTGNVGRFGAESIHNTSNIIRLDTTIHRQVSGYYSSIQPFTGGQTVRQWLSGQSFDAQRQFGLEVLERFGAAG